MPLYEFKCPACGVIMEEIMSFEESEKPDAMPCVCQPGMLMTKQISTGTNAHYKCNGFYTTDYKKLRK